VGLSCGWIRGIAVRVCLRWGFGLTLVFKSKRDVALENLDAAGEAVFVGILVPLVEDIEFLIGGGLEVFHA
jgi:hypothetical protein